MNKTSRIKHNKKQVGRRIAIGASFITFLLICLLLPGASLAQNQPGGESSALYPGGLASLAKNILMSYNLFEEGKTLYEKEDYLNARVKFQQALLRDPKNNKAKKYLSLCDKKRVAAKKSKKTSDKTEKMIDEEELAFLKELETRISNLETEKPVKYTPHAEQEKSPEVSPAPTSDESAPPPAKQTKTVPSLEEIRRAKKTEQFISQGDKFYAERDYEKAYKYYKDAFENFNSK